MYLVIRVVSVITFGPKNVINENCFEIYCAGLPVYKITYMRVLHTFFSGQGALPKSPNS